MLECVIGIIIDGHRVRVGDVLGPDNPLYETALKFASPRKYGEKVVSAVFFTSPGKKEDVNKPATISEIARSRAFNPAFKKK